MAYNLHMERTARVFVLAGLALASITAVADEVPKETLPGARNYTRVDALVACGGATDPAVAFPELAKRGFRAVVNFRTAAEADARLEEEAAAAKAAGLAYLHLPLSSTSPDPSVVDRFLEAVVKPEHQPAYVHCASANRVGAVWLVKRALLDGWSLEKATAEAELIGLKSEVMRTFALEYLKAKGTPR
jgi:uncharacterized protein (TIGR01244 family)